MSFGKPTLSESEGSNEGFETGLDFELKCEADCWVCFCLVLRDVPDGGCEENCSVSLVVLKLAAVDSVGGNEEILANCLLLC